MDRPIDSKPPSKNRVRHLDRITISEESLQKLDSLIGQMVDCNKGIRLTRNDLVNWIIKNHVDEFSGAQRRELETTFFDSVKYAKWVLSHVKEAKNRGENLTIKIINEGVQTLTDHPQRTKRVRKKHADPTSNERLNVTDDQHKEVE